MQRLNNHPREQCTTLGTSAPFGSTTQPRTTTQSMCVQVLRSTIYLLRPNLQRQVATAPTSSFRASHTHEHLCGHPTVPSQRISEIKHHSYFSPRREWRE
ncbi:hypothetical protein OG21DRAFT_1505777 [Imleria badia]|nr:hypothetical protein OG21DRAFT_1505777 [Imleria badia]